LAAYGYPVLTLGYCFYQKNVEIPHIALNATTPHNNSVHDCGIFMAKDTAISEENRKIIPKPTQSVEHYRITGLLLKLSQVNAILDGNSLF
jgi:hypothetical protein